ncbi:threonine synthase [Paenibacillus mucilaginosus]|uniref:Threonine synthase n=3 Tax=Paenibacillus mucilaginosus TaxID=61624 RepID=H6NAN5_9BACL|nr:threonine synthase [Paenibacillus mucilaginosus]AEI41415.1 threonine synthase [Paenibacillus mucilaginosus KNP414]AFC29960.1 threonine synthase [Paenibacillus mucilaginosus 3016]AFH62145.1 threonine synthase [Paenibacillus mucilaginosus K02]MCG7217548.1 threonine synthase [Paenibacillus mucilaginosus]WDM30434.1 threonine synthase [Paenibacillus mucilaginosus]
MNFISTRGKTAGIGFIDTVLMGLADDGGLLIPNEIPHISAARLKEMESLSYQDLAYEVFSYYTNNEIPDEDLKDLIRQSYATFRDPEVTPVKKLTDNMYVMELFHGPTFAFKDVALQFLGNLYAYVSKKQNEIIHILGATSGDTGASAIEGVRGKEGIRICILHPHQKVSRVQELQMTTVDDENVLNLSVEGTFDDCQRIIKDLFADVPFKTKYHLRAINSINFVRILAQTVYYFYAYFRVQKDKPGAKVNFSVPTGNFGDIFAGYLAKRMGLPVNKLILATNENNILERFVLEGVYRPGEFKSTHSPSMDIQVASNFERYLYYLLGENPQQAAAYMEGFKTDGVITIAPELLSRVQADFAAHGVGGEECLATIGSYYREHGYLLDPHTACGVAAYEKCSPAEEVCVTLSTAHPAKFNESIELVGIEQTYPQPIQDLFAKPQHQEIVDSSVEEIVRRLESFYTK